MLQGCPVVVSPRRAARRFRGVEAASTGGWGRFVYSDGARTLHATPGRRGPGRAPGEARMGRIAESGVSLAPRACGSLLACRAAGCEHSGMSSLATVGRLHGTSFGESNAGEGGRWQGPHPKANAQSGNSRNHGVLTKLIFLLLDSVAKCRIPRLHPNEPLFALGGT